MHRVKLFIPGPTQVREEILERMARPMIGHRSEAFSDLMDRVLQKLHRVLQTDFRIQVHTASGTGLMEAAIRNFVHKDVLVTVIGAFGQRWATIARSNGKSVDVLEVEWGQAISPEQLADVVKKKPYEAVCITHNETSTGVMNPLKELADAVKDVSPHTLVLVDAVSSMFGAPLYFGDWHLDFVLTGSQKALALPPGLAIGVISETAFEKAQQVPDRGYYFDLIEMQRYIDERRQTPTTPAISLFYALDAQLDRILEEGIENRWKRHQEMAQIVQNWAQKHFALFANPRYLSWTVTIVANTRKISISDLNRELFKRGFTISNGYGKLKEKTFRIGHMGDLTPEEVQELLLNIDTILGLE